MSEPEKKPIIHEPVQTNRVKCVYPQERKEAIQDFIQTNEEFKENLIGAIFLEKENECFIQFKASKPLEKWWREKHSKELGRVETWHCKKPLFEVQKENISKLIQGAFYTELVGKGYKNKQKSAQNGSSKINVGRLQEIKDEILLKGSLKAWFGEVNKHKSDKLDFFWANEAEFLAWEDKRLNYEKFLETKYPSALPKQQVKQEGRSSKPKVDKGEKKKKEDGKRVRDEENSQLDLIFISAEDSEFSEKQFNMDELKKRKKDVSEEDWEIFRCFIELFARYSIPKWKDFVLLLGNGPDELTVVNFAKKCKVMNHLAHVQKAFQPQKNLDQSLITKFSSTVAAAITS